MMHTLVVAALIGFGLAGPAAAQQAQAPQQPPTVSGYLRNAYTGNKNNILRSGEKMPEEFYGLRPGPQMEVRSFAQHLAHVANYNFLWCSQAKGEKNPGAGNTFEKTLTAKADVMKALADSFAYCDPVYAALTDASGAEVLEFTQESGRQVRQPRMALLIMNLAHNNELYGNLVTTMRMKSIVPPSSEPRPQQPAPQR